jgi:uncharacterized protein (DUF488 family)
MRVYTLGYEGLTPEAYVRALTDAGVGIVLDVRERAWSQRPAFVKSTLARSLREAGIAYLHCPEAGNPSANRKSARSAAECLTRYRLYLQSHRSCLQELLTEIRTASADGRYACLTCYEHDYDNCHRGILIEEMAALNGGFGVIHLAPSIPQRKVKPRRPGALAATAFLTPTLFPLT